MLIDTRRPQKEHGLRTWTWPFFGMVLALLVACGRKEDPPPTFTLAPTMARPTATATPAPTATLTPTSTAMPPTATPSPTPTEVPLAALVNGQPILLADYENEVERAKDAVTPDEVLTALIEMVLLEQAAAAAGVTVSDMQLDAILQADVEAVGGMQAFKIRLASNNLTEEEYRDQLRVNLIAQRVQMQLPGNLPETMEHVHARHILVATEAEAQAILAQIQNGADFGTLAQTYSLDVSTRDRGGDLGYFPRGLLLTPELEESAFALAPGEISGIIHSDLLGYHIVQVLEREERTVDAQNVELIRANQIRRWRERLWADADIERYVEP